MSSAPPRPRAGPPLRTGARPALGSLAARGRCCWALVPWKGVGVGGGPGGGGRTVVSEESVCGEACRRESVCVSSARVVCGGGAPAARSPWCAGSVIGAMSPSGRSRDLLPRSGRELRPPWPDPRVPGGQTRLPGAEMPDSMSSRPVTGSEAGRSSGEWRSAGGSLRVSRCLGRGRRHDPGTTPA